MTRIRPSARSGGLLLAAVGLLLGLPGTALAEPATSDPADAAAGWLTTQLVDGDGDGVGDHIEVVIDLNGDGQITDDERFPDYGLTADTVIALAAAGVGGESSTAATDYLAANVEQYVGVASGVGDPDGEFYAGALAKIVLVAEVTGRDPESFGGVDVLARLLATETPQGRFSDISAFGDFSNNIGQSLAVVALQRAAPDQLSASAAEFLAGQQCADGALAGNVPLTIGADPCLADSGSVDTTAFAVQALAAVDDQLPAVAGLQFLTGSQGADGGFSDLGVENANSTGLAAQALRVGGLDGAADAAVGWLLDRQLDCSAPVEQQGAIAFTDDGGGAPLYDDRATRATTQAVPGVTGVGLAEVDAAGSTPGAPRLDCPTPTPTSPAPTTAPSPTPTSSSTSTSTHPGVTTQPTPGAPGLPNTGVDMGPLLGAAGLSLVLGLGLLAVGRRRPGLHR